ncbi:hypothetical protein BT69DRAFT_683547 [Atractiella rhizophila]|nr:hypothetical protein BT69DRAFT_683547 [Atractiella rhizophila]
MSAHDVVYELLYQVVQPGDENQLVGKTSVIEFPTNKTVAALEEAILQKLGEKLHGKEFDLWMLDPMLAIEEEELLKAIRFPSERLRKLHPANRLSKYWQEAPHDGHLHIVAQLHDSPLVVQHQTSLWQAHGNLDQYQSLARIMTLNAGSFEPHALLEANKLLPVHDSGDPDIVNAFRRVKNTLGQLFQLPDMPDAVTRAIGTSLKNEFFPRGPATQGRIATAAELRHYHEVATAHPFLARFSDNKEPYFNWTYMMPVAREISRRRYGSDQVSDFTAGQFISILTLLKFQRLPNRQPSL